MADHRCCDCTFRGENHTTENADLYINCARWTEFTYGLELFDGMSEEGFELIHHSIAAEKSTPFSHKYFTFSKGSSSLEFLSSP